ncbi:ferritin-like domain-containing protein [Aequorivita capsosiphonis]|uniref:YciE/YciF ferroxidase family protein n=1 Tax=Aequorivita capsosiphonis TaxID=487317 RepID=UPI00040DFB38|nr:ferritin-like domain-containing protein [Aequorivita capsosiphonis]
MKTLKDLFEHQLKDLYSAEEQLINALPKMVENAKDEKLKKAFTDHLEETKGHKRRLEEVCDELGIDPFGETCKAMQGLIKEAESFLKEDMTDAVKNAGIIGEAQRVEHYEISGYGTVCTYAEELGYNDIAKKLKKTLDEEYGSDDKLKKLAKDRLNEKAM